MRYAQSNGGGTSAGDEGLRKLFRNWRRFSHLKPPSKSIADAPIVSKDFPGVEAQPDFEQN
jgi:hypothetical protein